MARARVVLAEDHAEVAELLQHILEAEFEVAAMGMLLWSSPPFALLCVGSCIPRREA